MALLKSFEDQARHQHDALAAADASFSLALERYRSGLSPQTNALDAESLLLDARRSNAALAASCAPPVLPWACRGYAQCGPYFPFIAGRECLWIYRVSVAEEI